VARLFYEECEIVLFTSTLLDADYPGGMVVCVASDDYEVIEDVHLAICHALKKEVKARLM
jgi:hypothetical protein